MHLDIVPNQRTVYSLQIIKRIVENRGTVSSSVEIEGKLLTGEAIVVRVVAIGHVPGPLHSFLFKFAYYSGGWVTTSGIIDRLWLGQS